jgi:acyl carrier protein
MTPLQTKAAEIVAQVIRHRCRIKPEHATLETRVRDIGADEYDRLGIQMAIEDDLFASIPEAAMASADTVGDLAELVERYGVVTHG